MSVRVLFVEDRQDDVELQLRRLRDAHVDPQWDRVQTEEALCAALADETWNIALVDYNIPGFSGLEALRLIAELAPDVPAITVSGSIDEDTAVATMSAGALDYVLKDNLTRLAPAVGRAIDSAELRRDHRRTAESARLALFAVDHASLSIMTTALDGTVVYVNEFTCGVFGVGRDELVGRKIWDLDEHITPDMYGAMCAQVVENGAYEFRVDRRQADGRRLVLDTTANYLDGTDAIITYGRDITRRVAAEERMRQSEEQFKRFAERIPGFVTMKDADHRYVFVSIDESGPAAKAGDSWEGRPPEDMWPADEAAHVHEVAERVLAGEVVDEVTEWQGDGAVRHYHELHFPISRENGPPLVGGLSLDVTEQVEAQDEVLRQAEQLRRTVEGAVQAMSQVVETRDPYTAGHERRVAELATAIGREMGLAPDALEGLRLAALIHDIGKISVPAEILAKPGRLSEVEFNLIKQHAQAGYDILEAIDFGWPVAEMVLQHHERLDGSGYPHGLAGDELMPDALLLAVADVVEAMSSHRPYRPALGTGAAMAEIRDGMGTRYDAAVASACIRVIEEQGFQFTP